MKFRDVEKKIGELEAELASIDPNDQSEASRLRAGQLTRDRGELLATLRHPTAEDKVYLARHPHRPNITAYIDALFDDFFELKGDHLCREDGSILGGIAFYHGQPVTVIGHRKGRNLEENMACLLYTSPSPRD